VCFRVGMLKRLDPLGLKCDTITSPRRLVTTFLTSNSTEFRIKVITIPSTSSSEPGIQSTMEDHLAQTTSRLGADTALF
jgi:hypothetical protein